MMEMVLLSFAIRAPDHNPRLHQVAVSRSPVRLNQGTLSCDGQSRVTRNELYQTHTPRNSAFLPGTL